MYIKLTALPDPETYTEVITRGASFFVTQTLDEIQTLIKEAQ